MQFLALEFGAGFRFEVSGIGDRNVGFVAPCVFFLSGQTDQPNK